MWRLNAFHANPQIQAPGAIGLFCVDHGKHGRNEGRAFRSKSAFYREVGAFCIGRQIPTFSMRSEAKSEFCVLRFFIRKSLLLLECVLAP